MAAAQGGAKLTTDHNGNFIKIKSSAQNVEQGPTEIEINLPKDRKPKKKFELRKDSQTSSVHSRILAMKNRSYTRDIETPKL